MKKIKQAFIFLILPAFLFSCTTMKDVKRPPKLGFDDPVLSKRIDYRGTEGIPKDPTTSFTIQDREVVASVKLTDLTGKHRLRWEWYTPDGKRYSSSKDLSIKASRDKYLREATAWHKLSIRGENAANYTKGYWRVKIYLDKRLIASKPFEILEREREREVADTIRPEITLSSPSDNFKTADETIILTGKVIENVKFAKLQIKLGDKVLYDLRDLDISQEEGVGSVSDIVQEITLNIGRNEITVEAVDEAGNKAQKTLVVLKIKPIKPTKLGRKGKTWAVIIGIGKYDNLDIKELKYATADAELLYKTLTDPRYGEVPKGHVRLLLDKQATSREIKGTIGTWLRRKAHKDDTVIIFFAGHGAPEEKQTYWVTFDADIDNLYGTALSNDDVVKMLERVKAEKRLVFLDSCYSAATVEGTRALSIKGDPFKKFIGTGNVTITSSSGQQESLELDKFGHGIFTHFLVKALKGESDKNKDGYIELDEVWDYVQVRVDITAREHGKEQTPTMKAEGYSGKIRLSKDPVRLEKLARVAEEKRKKGEFDFKKNKLKEWQKNGDITIAQLSKALEIISSGKKNEYLEKAFSGEMSPKAFGLVFE